MPAIMSREQVCDYLSIGRDKLRELICSGEIKPIKLPGADYKDLRFRTSDIDKLVDSLEHIQSSKDWMKRQEMAKAAREAKATIQAAKKKQDETRSE